MEKWKEIKIIDGLYSISNTGRIRNNRTFRILKQSKGRLDRPIISIQKTINKIKKRYTLNVHRLVAEYFIGPRPNGYHTNHIDGDKFNNNAENLEYLSPEDHLKHTMKNGLRPKGNDFPFTKINPSIVKEIRKIKWKNDKKKPSLADIGKVYNLSQNHIHGIITRKSWKHI